MPDPEELPAVAIPENQGLLSTPAELEESRLSAANAIADVMARIEMLMNLPEEDLLAMLGEEFMKLPEAERARILAEDISSEAS